MAVCHAPRPLCGAQQWPPTRHHHNVINIKIRLRWIAVMCIVSFCNATTFVQGDVTLNEEEVAAAEPGVTYNYRSLAPASRVDGVIFIRRSRPSDAGENRPHRDTTRNDNDDDNGANNDNNNNNENSKNNHDDYFDKKNDGNESNNKNNNNNNNDDDDNNNSQHASKDPELMRYSSERRVTWTRQGQHHDMGVRTVDFLLETVRGNTSQKQNPRVEDVKVKVKAKMDTNTIACAPDSSIPPHPHPNNFSASPCSSTITSTSTNDSYVFGQQRYSKLYNTVACALSATIFTFGLLGNILVIIVISRTRSMHTTTNCYLLSLSVADSLVLLAATLPAIPETFFRVDEWPYGRVMCSMLIFLQYLGVDSSSLSITAFTIERYIAICHPMRAQTMCTLSRAKKIIGALWGFTILYCSPWLGLTEIKVYLIPGQDPMYRCQHRLARSSYLLLYMIDLILFYVIPLIVAIILYLLIGRILFFSRTMSRNIQFTGRGMPRKVSQHRTDSRVQVVRMLVVVVVVFATLWMPYRVMVVYNSFAQHKFMDLWFLLFARTMVYANCAINPILYNIMSVKFKRAFRNYLSCCKWHRRERLPPSSCGNEMNTDVWATRRNTALRQHQQIQLQQQQQQHHHHQLQQQQQQQQQQYPKHGSEETHRLNNNTSLTKTDERRSGNQISSNHVDNNTIITTTSLGLKANLATSPQGQGRPDAGAPFVNHQIMSLADSSGANSTVITPTNSVTSRALMENAV